MKRTMTLQPDGNGNDRSRTHVRGEGLSKIALVRQALRLYKSVDERLARGEKVFVESADKAEKTELMVL